MPVGTRAPLVKPVGYCLVHDDIIAMEEFSLYSEVYLDDSLSIKFFVFSVSIGQ